MAEPVVKKEDDYVIMKNPTSSSTMSENRLSMDDDTVTKPWIYPDSQLSAKKGIFYNIRFIANVSLNPSNLESKLNSAIKNSTTDEIICECINRAWETVNLKSQRRTRAQSDISRLVGEASTRRAMYCAQLRVIDASIVLAEFDNKFDKNIAKFPVSALEYVSIGDCRWLDFIGLLVKEDAHYVCCYVVQSLDGMAFEILSVITQAMALYYEAKGYPPVSETFNTGRSSSTTESCNPAEQRSSLFKHIAEIELLTPELMRAYPRIAYLSNLPPDTQEIDVYNWFCGQEISSVKLDRDACEVFLGTAKVEFIDMVSFDNAMKNPVQLPHGKSILISKKKPRSHSMITPYGYGSMPGPADDRGASYSCRKISAPDRFDNYGMVGQQDEDEYNGVFSSREEKKLSTVTLPKSKPVIPNYLSESEDGDNDS